MYHGNSTIHIYLYQVIKDSVTYRYKRYTIFMLYILNIEYVLYRVYTIYGKGRKRIFLQ